MCVCELQLDIGCSEALARGLRMQTENMQVSHGFFMMHMDYPQEVLMRICKDDSRMRFMV